MPLKSTTISKKKSEDNGGEPSKPRGARVRRWMVIVLVVAVVGAFLVNGPVFRWAVSWGLGQGLEMIGREGNFEVEGTLVGGLAVRGLETRTLEDVEEETMWQELSVELASVDYRFSSLLRGKVWEALERVRLHGARVELDLGKAEDEEDPSEPDPAGEDPLAMVWKLLGTTFDLRDIHVKVFPVEGEPVVVEGLAVQVPSEGSGSLEVDHLRIGEKVERKGVRAGILVESDSLTLVDLKVSDSVSLVELRLAEGQEPWLGASLRLGGGKVDVTYGREGDIGAQLREGSVDLAAVAADFPGDPLLESGQLTGLDVEMSSLMEIPSLWAGEARVTVMDLQVGEYTLDRAQTEVKVDGGVMTGELKASEGEARLGVDAVARFEEGATMDSLVETPTEVRFTLEVPQVATFLPENAPAVGGGANVSGSLRIAGKEILAGEAKLAAADLRYEGVPVQALSGEVTIPSPGTLKGSLDVALDDANKAQVKGEFDLEAQRYDGLASAEVSVTERLQELLRAAGVEASVAGGGTLEWNGGGRLGGGEEEKPAHHGEANLTFSQIQIGDGRVVQEGRLAGSYETDAIRVSTLEIQSGDLALSAEGVYEDDWVTISRLAVRRGDQSLASGSLSLPYRPEAVGSQGVEGFFAQEGAISLELTTQDLPLETLAEIAGQDPPVQGVVNAGVSLSGTLQDMTGEGEINASGLKTARAPEVPPGDLSIAFSIADKRLGIDGRFVHPEIEDLSLQAAAPFRPGAWAAGEAGYAEEPLEASVTLPKSSLGFLKGYVSQIEAVAGTVSLGVTVTGTVGQPVVEGRAEVRLSDLKFYDPSLPELRDTEVVLLADGESRALTVEEFSSVVSGGRISLGGEVRFPAESEDGPQLDLSVTAREALLARSQDYNVRADADLKLSGPWLSARLSGRLGLTNSRFVKDIDILPVELPGRERSNLPEIERRAPAGGGVPRTLEPGIDAEPFKDWALDVVVVTKDPFLIRGNLARGEVISDLRVTGTAGRPIPSGKVYLREARLTLPFSKVDVGAGQVVFSEQTGFNGEVTLDATAVVRQYDIMIYVYGRLFTPEYVLTSDPPLPNEDIISLLATGTTREELTSGDGGVAASKAAQLFLKKLRQENIDPDEEPSFFQELDERTTLDVGQTDARTGEHTVAGRIRLLRQLHLEGNVSQEGDYRGLLKYIFKFR